jgi:Protein of unknown function (DUF2634).
VATLPEGVGMDVSLEPIEEASRTFLIDWSARQISGMDSGLAAMQQAVDIALGIERFEWQIYSSNFGRELEDLVGEERDYIISELPRRVEEALLVDNRILSVENFEFSDAEADGVICKFDVITVFGMFGREVVL